MTVSILSKGDRFRLEGQRKFRQVANIVPVPDRETTPENHRGKLIVTTTECGQFILAPFTECEIQIAH